jgi:carbonic anhydrase
VEAIRKILDNNKAWVRTMTDRDPGFFEVLAKGQSPNYLFIGCSDSRVPANEITGTGPGEMFVHRNIANQIFPSDLSMLSVLQYAVEVLDVKHVIVCGHYGCGGVKAGCGPAVNGTVDHWLGQVRELNFVFQSRLAQLPDDEQRHRMMVQLSVLRGVRNLANTPIVQNMWKRGPRPMLHGLVYDIRDGLLDPLVIGLDSWHHVDEELRDLWGVVERHQATPLDFSDR